MNKAIFQNNEIFEGFKDKKTFRIPHGWNYMPSVIDTLVRGVEESFNISFDEKYLYLTFEKAPNKRFLFSWD